MALALDGHVTGTWSSGASFASGGLTTANGSDVIVACVNIISSPAVTVSSISATGTTGWTVRKQLTYNTTDSVEIWYGTASGTLSAQAITINLSGTPSGSAQCSVFGVSGANTASISDSNVSLPATSTGSTSTPTVTGVSTSNANDFIVSAVGCAGNVTQTAGANFTLNDTISSGAGGGTGSVASERDIVSATQSSISVAFGTSSTPKWAMIVDAIQQASAAATATYGTPRLLMGVGT